MSLEGNSVHIRLSDEGHKKLLVMSNFHDRNLSDLGAQLLEKMIVAEFHDFTIAAERYARLGLSAYDREKTGSKSK